MQGHLTDVKEIQASANSFAALTMQGSVVTWGPGVDDMGAKVKKRLAAKGRIRAIQYNENAFAAITESGSVITWGDEESGGAMPDGILSSSVDAIQSAGEGFCAVTQDKTAVPWGRQNSFGVRCFPSTPIHNVEKVFDGRRYAAQPLTAILQGGSIKRWKSAYVWDSPPKADTCQDEVSDTSQDEVADAPDPTYGFRAAPPSELQDVVKLQANQHGMGCHQEP